MMSRARHALRFISFVATFAAALAIGGCNYLSITPQDNIQEAPVLFSGKENAPVYNSSVIKGTVIGQEKSKGPTLLVAYTHSAEGAPFADYILLDKSRTFMLYLPAGCYQLYTFTDRNNDGVYKETEVSGVYGSPGSPKEIVLEEGDVIRDIVIRSSQTNGDQLSYPKKFRIREDYDTVCQRTYNGQVVKIYNEMFAPENGTAGWWNPTAFMKAMGARIYFLEEYDPAKIPILFIHGAGGTPQIWADFLIRMDRKRYQPWFFYYPSGLRLSLASRLLSGELAELQGRYGFGRIAIAAHSMGGLVGRAMLIHDDYEKQKNAGSLFVTFATPWSGFESADASQWIPYRTIPSWMDIRSQSIFIKRTMDADLPRSVRHYLFYGKEDTVSKGKALDERATASAQETIGFDCTHDTILTDRKVFLKFRDILDREFGR